jgi:hypothetical protein
MSTTMVEKKAASSRFKRKAFESKEYMSTDGFMSCLYQYYICDCLLLCTDLAGIRYAFYDYKGFKEPVFIGLKHFESMFS